MTTKIKDEKALIGFWIYGPQEMFPNGYAWNMPKGLSSSNPVRVAFTFPYAQLPKADEMVFTIGSKSYLGKRISVTDVDSMGFDNRPAREMEGVELCEYTSRRASQNQSSKTESKEPSQHCPRDGEIMGLDSFTGAFA